MVDPPVKSAPSKGKRRKQYSVEKLVESHWEKAQGTAPPARRRKDVHHIPSPNEELHRVSERHGPDSWQVKTIKLVNSAKVQHLLMALLLIDVIILFTEMFLDAHYPLCYFIERDSIACCPKQEDGSRNVRARSARRFLSGSSDGVCEAPLENFGSGDCDPHKWHAVHVAHDVLFWTTIAILSIFLVENAVLMVVLGLRAFFSRLLYVFDLFIVVVSLVLEITFRVLSQDDVSEFVGLLIIGRVWRFVRVGHGLVTSTSEVEKELNEKLVEYARLLEEELASRDILLPEMSVEEHHFRMSLMQHIKDDVHKMKSVVHVSEDHKPISHASEEHETQENIP